MSNLSKNIFICFSARDRYSIVQPIVYHLKNYGINVWYDRYELLMGDDRVEKNIEEGAGLCEYALIVLSSNTIESICAKEEIQILKTRYYKNEVVIFPVLYEIKPCNIPSEFSWIRTLIFKEVNRTSGTLEICNHIACRITQDIISFCKCKSIKEIINANLPLPKSVNTLLDKYIQIDSANLNSRITLLYAIYTIVQSNYSTASHICEIPTKVFERLFAETILSLPVDYRDIWLLENSLCILIDNYVLSCIESNI